MRQYAVSATINGRNVEEIVLASSGADAIAVVRARYTNVVIYGARLLA